MSDASKTKLNEALSKLEVSAANLVTEVQGLKTQITTAASDQQDSDALVAAAVARLAVVQAAIDAVATPAATIVEVPAVA